jgi:putative oxidoreductase
MVRHCLWGKSTLPTDLSSLLVLLARLLLGGAFIVFGIRNLGNIPKLTAGMTARNVPMPALCSRIGVGLQLASGVLTAFGPGIFGVLGGLGGIVFVYVAAFIFHAPWVYPAAERYPHYTAWIMNTALAGAFLFVIAASL